MHSSNSIGALALGVHSSSVYTQITTYCTGKVCYAVNVPESTASSGIGDVFFKISGPSTMSWLGLGQGESMTGANIFMVYANSAGTNVTLSPRMGVGEQEPKSNSAVNVTLLSGSGISDGMMTANVKCSNCSKWSGGSMSFTDPSSSWIWSYKSGPPVSSDDITVHLPFHSSYGTAKLNLRSAAGGNSANPFASTAALSSTATSSSSGKGGKVSIPADFIKVRLAHSILASVSFVIFMPFGAIIIRSMSFKNLIWLHAGWMMCAYTMALASLGMGVWIAVTIHKTDSAHAIIGLVVIGFLLLQPVFGLLHHMRYKRTGRPNFATYQHIWWGRAIITLAIINGGLGLQLAAPYQANTRTGGIVYGVVAGVAWLTWMVAILVAFLKSRGVDGETGERIFSSDGEKQSVDGSGSRFSETGSSPATQSYSAPEDITASQPGRALCS